MKFAYVITQRGDKSFWTRIGVAFVNRDGSINVKLEAFPVNGELQLRDQRDDDNDGAPASSGNGNRNANNNQRRGSR